MEGREPAPDRLTAREHEILARLSDGLSDQQIADELFLSLNTVKWYNRQIYSKLGVSSRTQAVMHTRVFGLIDKDVPPPPLPAFRHGLPAETTPFIGRDREIGELARLLAAHRLLTLIGTGGIGKTRLALRVASEVAGTFPDGVYFVDLAPLSDAGLVANAIARALRVVENSEEPLPDTLKRVLARRQLVLLIDNFEHVIRAAPLLSELLVACPHLKVLVTSREPLRLSGEQTYPVPPLSLPVAGVVSPQALAASEAGQLFVQRARMAWPHFVVSDDNAPAIAALCARLDGLPLAIELAAARSRLLSPLALLARLEGTKDDSPLRALTGGSRDAPPRQRTLRDSIEWSYNLLDWHDKVLLARLAVFRGGRSLEAIEAVCGHDLSVDIIDGLASLVDKSLVQPKESPGGEPRFVLLEMIHEYVRERLEAGGEAETMRRRHATYFVEWTERAEPELRRARYDYWCRQFELELDNLRAVLEWTLDAGDVSLGVRLAGALGLFWYGKGHHVEGARWMQQLLGRLDEVPSVYHPRFLISAGHLAWLHDLDAAQQLFRRALNVSRDLGDQLQVAWSLAFLGYAMMREPKDALPLAEQSLDLFRALNHSPGIAQTLNIIGEIARLSGDDDRATRAYEGCLAVSQETGENRRICYMNSNLAYVAQHAGDHRRALELGCQSLRLARERMDRRDMAEALQILAGSIAALGQPERAARLLGAAETALERMGAFVQPSDAPEYDRNVEAVRSQLDESTFARAWTQGRELRLRQAVEDVLADYMCVFSGSL